MTVSSVVASTLLALAAACKQRRKNDILLTGDVSTAFLHTSLPWKKKCFLASPTTEHKGGTLWRLRKALYGQWESSRWLQ
eukprot:1634977-Heterocapsa_arctica.AAC.1